MSSIDDFKSLIPVISKSAPILSTLLGGPLAGVLVTMISHVFGHDSGSSLQDLIEKINLDPDSASKLQTLEHEHAQKMLELSIEKYKAESDDRDDARRYQLDFIAKTGRRDYMMPFLIVLLFSSVAGIVYCMIEANTILANTLSMILGILLREIPAIYSFYFGDSKENT